MHGKTSLIHHDGTGVFAGLPSPFRATRYHSLVIAPESVPPTLRVTAWVDDTTEDGESCREIMAVEHRHRPVTGVQFHPESALTEHGYRILDRFLRGPASNAGALPSRADVAPAVPAGGSVFDGEDDPDERFVPPPVDLVR
jgi:GMP synthase-like glutamine amidotransferase